MKKKKKKKKAEEAVNVIDCLSGMGEGSDIHLSMCGKLNNHVTILCFHLPIIYDVNYPDWVHL